MHQAGYAVREPGQRIVSGMPDEITVLLDKGSRDSVWLEHVSARVTWEGNERPEPIDMSDEIHRLRIHRKKMVWDQPEAAGRSIAVSPGEAVSLARYTKVPASKPVRVEVMVFGIRTFWTRRGFQWRASAVALPLPPSASANSHREDSQCQT